MTPELIADYRCNCGEGPIWNPVQRKLYWVDIPTGSLFRYDPAAGEHEQVHSGPALGGITVQTDGSMLMFLAAGAIARWAEGEVTYLRKQIDDEVTTRFNDVIADPAGRVLCGTMPTKQRPGRLYRLDRDGSLTILLEGLACSNGLAFTLDRKQMYLADSIPRQIYLFDYDVAAGELSNRRIFATVPEGQGLPDGLTVDAEGFVWSARWDGGCLVRYAPDGTEDRRIQFPARKVSSVTFAGDDYSDMYVTTAGGGKKETEGAGAGALFHLKPGVEGLPEFASRVKLP